MEDYERTWSSATLEEDTDVRKGPWTEEEDAILVNYVSLHGDGRWNTIARYSGLKRTGKSCRLRWLNYLRPDVRRGNITLQEQFLILELHSRWGNRWSKIAQYLPGRTDNEIKNYWRTRVQKQAKHLNCEVNSKLFKDTVKYVWMPRLLERIHAQSSDSKRQLEKTMSTASSQPIYRTEPELDQLDPVQLVPEFSSTSSNSPDAQASTISESSGLVYPDGVVNGSGPNKYNTGLEEFSDWVCGEDTMEMMSLWNEDSFWFLQ